MPNDALQNILREPQSADARNAPRPPLTFEEAADRLQALQDRINVLKKKQ